MGKRWALVAAWLLACGSPAEAPLSLPPPVRVPELPSRDADRQPIDAASRVDAAVIVALDAAPMTPPEPMLDCVGRAHAPQTSTRETEPFALVEYGQVSVGANMELCVCADGVLSPEALAPTFTGSCGTCAHVTTDAYGQASAVVAPGGWLAYRVFACVAPEPDDSLLDTIDTNRIAVSSRMNLVAIGPSAFVELLGPTTLAANVLVGNIVDCAGVGVAGATVRLFGADGVELSAGSPPMAPLVVNYAGSTTATTTVGGRFVLANLPASTGGSVVRVEAWRRPTDHDVPVRIGCEAVPVLPSSGAITTIGPLRAIYPDGHPCL